MKKLWVLAIIFMVACSGCWPDGSDPEPAPKDECQMEFMYVLVEETPEIVYSVSAQSPEVWDFDGEQTGRAALIEEASTVFPKGCIDGDILIPSHFTTLYYEAQSTGDITVHRYWIYVTCRRPDNNQIL